MQLVLAILVASCKLTLVTFRRPYRSATNNLLAVFAAFALQIFLVLAFNSNSEAEHDQFHSNDITYSVPMVFAISSAPLIFALMVPLELVHERALRAVPTVRLGDTGEEPQPTLPAGAHFHVFLSHAWATVSDQNVHRSRAPHATAAAGIL